MILAVVVYNEVYEEEDVEGVKTFDIGADSSLRDADVVVVVAGIFLWPWRWRMGDWLDHVVFKDDEENEYAGDGNVAVMAIVNIVAM